MKKIEDYVVTIPDFPEPGIIFRDVTSVIQDADGLQLAIDEMQKLLDGVEFDVIAGAESRGFIFGMPLAYNLHKPFIPIPISTSSVSSGASAISNTTTLSDRSCGATIPLSSTTVTW